ncbi:hypothetical protein D9615_002050 [Tricholomella constricta]|uniref:Uncharacterized protein n=1 Tax=Tricholomella constricta TaxID=117010 RepID=A0A8H5HQ30_9AGAR|nr:hypothetical protein D9615_002050 [Tricholomella constricta]
MLALILIIKTSHPFRTRRASRPETTTTTRSGHPARRLYVAAVSALPTRRAISAFARNFARAILHAGILGAASSFDQDTFKVHLDMQSWLLTTTYILLTTSYTTLNDTRTPPLAATITDAAAAAPMIYDDYNDEPVSFELQPEFQVQMPSPTYHHPFRRSSAPLSYHPDLERGLARPRSRSGP